MRKIITTTFITLDGVLQAPGGPEEDPTNGFNRGGWSVHYWDELMGNTMNEFMTRSFDLLLGRRTYEIFAAHWPYITGDPVSEQFNRTRKYVVSHKPLKLTWQNSTLITGDVSAGLKKLKEQVGNELWVHGSGNLIQTLLADNLIDLFYIWTFPMIVGRGKRLFAEGVKPQGLKLVDSKTSATGVIITAYEPAGDLITGSFALENPTEAELARRKRLAEEK